VAANRVFSVRAFALAAGIFVRDSGKGQMDLVDVDSDFEKEKVPALFRTYSLESALWGHFFVAHFWVSLFPNQKEHFGGFGD
jgi:hypothetical protein